MAHRDIGVVFIDQRMVSEIQVVARTYVVALIRNVAIQ
jgi:hypothetical protein